MSACLILAMFVYKRVTLISRRDCVIRIKNHAERDTEREKERDRERKRERERGIERWR